MAGGRRHPVNISEAWLLPVLQAMLDQFPFRLHGYHSDNGSEFINHTVSRLLNKLLIEQTKSRPRHSNDNGLAESKNGWVIRKHIGWGHIGAAHAEAFDQFYRQHFNPYLNFHRTCGVPEVRVTAKGNFGILHEGRLVCLYTYECDLGDGWEDAEVHGDSDEKRLEALKMGANLIQYVFTAYH